MTTYNRVIGTEGKYKIVDLFPYKIKDSKNFVKRNHIPYRRDSIESKRYAQMVWRRMVEGYWADDEGTHVFMIPSLYYHINLGTISIEDHDKTRRKAVPDMRDNEWIMHTYMFCCKGFSGFENDPDFTCNINVERLEKGQAVPFKVQERIAKTCKREDGEWKRYINPWDYLTHFYLIDMASRHKNLGLPLYENPNTNGIILASRKAAKTFNIAAAGTHEFITNGAKRYSQLKDKLSINMFVGSSDSGYVDSFLTAMEDSWRNVPGSAGGQDDMSPFFRDAVGPWNSDRDRVIQGYRSKHSSEIVGSKSTISKAVLVPHKALAGVSKRFTWAFLDEIGLQADSKKILKAMDASLKADKGKSGTFMGSGTGGDIDAIEETKDIFLHPKQFSMMGIPNYWKDGTNLIGLFIPVSYTNSDYKDEHGNTDLIAATKAIWEERNDISGGEYDSITEKRMNEPLDPSEMFLAAKSDFFNKDIISDRIDILENGLFRQKAKLYDLTLGKKHRNGTFDIIAKEHNRWSNVIDTFQAGKKTGELVVFEEPYPVDKPFVDFDATYMVVYDPHTDLQGVIGGSSASIKVYKRFPDRPLMPGEMFENIVATYKGRRDEDEDHELFLKLCMWYKCKGQYERNISGIPGFFNKYGAKWLLQESPYEAIKDITPSTRQRTESGIVMTDAVGGGLKTRSMGILRKWHKQVVYRDEIDAQFIQIETCYDLGFLYELANYDPKEGNYDDISAMCILMLWLTQESRPEQEGAEKHGIQGKDLTELGAAANRILSR